jgi:hypothetical protein
VHSRGRMGGCSGMDSEQSTNLLDEIPEHGPADLYPDDPVLEVEYIMQRFKRLHEHVPEEVCVPAPQPRCTGRG